MRRLLFLCVLLSLSASCCVVLDLIVAHRRRPRSLFVSAEMSDNDVNFASPMANQPLQTTAMFPPMFSSWGQPHVPSASPPGFVPSFFPSTTRAAPSFTLPSISFPSISDTIPSITPIVPLPTTAITSTTSIISTPTLSPSTLVSSAIASPSSVAQSSTLAPSPTSSTTVQTSIASLPSASIVCDTKCAVLASTLSTVALLLLLAGLLFFLLRHRPRTRIPGDEPVPQGEPAMTMRSSTAAERNTEVPQVNFTPPSPSIFSRTSTFFGQAVMVHMIPRRPSRAEYRDIGNRDDGGSGNTSRDTSPLGRSLDASRPSRGMNWSASQPAPNSVQDVIQ